ncbi:MAG: hypothetical protein O2923_07875 [Verrucomicrobia bacterium]|nr:hypothetical protein [Verrucomicrobiota bacterium]MDA1086264.1 hypothetical protein [Verrucomicrobiota bacterium]
MSEPAFEIGADGIDVDRIVAEIQATVEAKRARGEYADPGIARAELQNLANLKDESEFLSFYLECLRQSAFVDINDYEIVERRRAMSGVLVSFKRLIWKILKFYTYRLWSQQNQVNGLLLTAVENLDNQYRSRIKELEERVHELEGRGADSSDSV